MWSILFSVILILFKTKPVEQNGIRGRVKTHLFIVQI